MVRHRRDTQDSGFSALHRPLRVVASGTLFLTNTLGLPTHPEPNAVVRAHSVSRVRGGSASTCLAIVAQFPSVEAMLVAPLGGNEEGRMIITDLEKERVSTRFCKVWPEAGVPSAWVLHADDTDSRTVINNNPLPDITHEEFISLLGPLLVPENYAYINAPSTPPATMQHPSSSNTLAPVNNSQPRASMSAPRPPTNSPAPIDWIHFEGRSVKTTLSNIVGLDGLARERRWRSHCVFSIDVGRRARQGVEALIPHADVIFLNKHYARAHSPQYASSPRAFLLSLTGIAPPHALLVAHWGSEGAAVLSVPTREYFQSTGWVEPNPPPLPEPAAMRMGSANGGRTDEADMQSIRTGSDFWAGAGNHTESSSTFTADLLTSTPQRPGRGVPQEGIQRPSKQRTKNGKRAAYRSPDRDNGDSSDSDGTQIAGHGGGVRPNLDAARARAQGAQNEILDEVGAQDAFVAGMMWALSRRLLPGEPYTPSAASSDAAAASDGDRERGRWRLEECLRFATELAGRKGRRKGWTGLAEEMSKAGWFDS
ncbi:hypothetical protein PYCCODRAFT_1440615 [Trametes coccinea BRFM310]|uniref:Carbohydrate kinase PfkB domain-containing protein n=1 Tax=Trametes coccinea (strain BRFM310) TaxID=1353009 RepID=A0A1Y2I790_TRAC3|nr:hypothetical protein PYCCODRAFT_1440615 [Trametes coccinea BRFM310]